MAKITITVSEDQSNEMAHVTDGNENSFEGNLWDFNNGCHGDNHLKEFRTVSEYVKVLKEFHELKGNTVEVVNKEYVY